jgi:two-component system KDP operon response regulator KdpE
MLSARGEEGDKVKCLNMGADDYVTKPFSIEELIARMKAVLRRAEALKSAQMKAEVSIGKLNLNFAERRVTFDGREIKLTPTEYRLLQELVLNAGKVLTHSLLLGRVWGPEYAEEREYLHVFIGRLRKELGEDQEKPKYIITVPGIGYRFRE